MCDRPKPRLRKLLGEFVEAKPSLRRLGPMDWRDDSRIGPSYPLAICGSADAPGRGTAYTARWHQGVDTGPGLAGCLDIGASGEFDSKRGASCWFCIVLDLAPQDD